MAVRWRDRRAAKHNCEFWDLVAHNLKEEGRQREKGGDEEFKALWEKFYWEIDKKKLYERLNTLLGLHSTARDRPNAASIKHQHEKRSEVALFRYLLPLVEALCVCLAVLSLLNYRRRLRLHSSILLFAISFVNFILKTKAIRDSFSLARGREAEEIEASFSSSLLSVLFFFSYSCCCCSSLWDLCEWGELGLAIGGNS